MGFLSSVTGGFSGSGIGGVFVLFFLSSGISGFGWIFQSANELRPFTLQLHLHATFTDYSFMLACIQEGLLC